MGAAAGARVAPKGPAITGRLAAAALPAKTGGIEGGIWAPWKVRESRSSCKLMSSIERESGEARPSRLPKSCSGRAAETSIMREPMAASSTWSSASPDRRGPLIEDRRRPLPKREKASAGISSSASSSSSIMKGSSWSADVCRGRQITPDTDARGEQLGVSGVDRPGVVGRVPGALATRDGDEYAERTLRSAPRSKVEAVWWGGVAAKSAPPRAPTERALAVAGLEIRIGTDRLDAAAEERGRAVVGIAVGSAMGRPLKVPHAAGFGAGLGTLAGAEAIMAGGEGPLIPMPTPNGKSAPSIGLPTGLCRRTVPSPENCRCCGKRSCPSRGDAPPEEPACVGCAPAAHTCRNGAPSTGLP